MISDFTRWIPWTERTELHDLFYPGIYAIAITSMCITGAGFSWLGEVVYIGMTNARGGLKSRLRQFDNTINGGYGHGGASRVRFKHPDYEALVRNLYVAVSAFPCDVTSGSPQDLRIMGEVAQYEYECFALFTEKFGNLPEFNDKKRSPKK